MGSDCERSALCESPASLDSTNKEPNCVSVIASLHSERIYMFLPPPNTKSRLIAGLICLAVVASVAHADSPPANTIPIIADRPSFDDIDTELLCMLSWYYFDAFQCGDHGAQKVFETIVEPASETNLYVSIAPFPIQRWSQYNRYWIGRISTNDIHSDSAYGRPAWNGLHIIWTDSTYYGPDTLSAVLSASAFQHTLEAVAQSVDSLYGPESCVWFYNTFDEANGRQWRHMVSESLCVDSVSGDTIPYFYLDDYVPSVFTTDSHAVYRGDLDTTLTLPTLSRVDPMGTFSWLKHQVESAGAMGSGLIPLTFVFSPMHTITDTLPSGGWAGFDNVDRDSDYPQWSGNSADLARSVRAVLRMGYRSYSNPLPDTTTNHPHMLMVDAYPFRHVGIDYQEDSSYTPALGDSLNTWLLEHYEGVLDSFFIASRQTLLDQQRDIPTVYWGQAFGLAGGDKMWDTEEEEDEIDYPTYAYRIPTPAEHRMNCGIALLRGARSLLPYCMVTYQNAFGSNGIAVLAGYLDRHNVPFDAPAEQWIYTDRHKSDFLWAPPDSVPPFIDSPYDFDPLYDLPARPDTAGQERKTQMYLEWKFAPYARLWNGFRDIHGDVARIAPELAVLRWWDGRETDASIVHGDSVNRPIHYIKPDIRVFTDSTETDCCLFYVNRYCRSNNQPYLIEVDSGDFPSGAVTELLLDHSRRFLVPASRDGSVYSLRDTMDAGHFRLVQFVDSSLAADVRITKADVFAEPVPSSIVPVRDFRFTAGNDVELVAVPYNVGTSGRRVELTLSDVSGGTAQVLDREYADLPALPTSGYQTASDTVSLTWFTDSTDIGVHVLEVAAATWTGEPDPEDNSVTITVLIDPRDYATEVLDDPWDMTEADSAPPDWHTWDVTGLTGYTASFSDSVGGMFEATVADPSANNELHLNVDSSAARRIDTSLYDQLSYAAMAGVPMEVEVWWTDEHDNDHYIELPDEIPADWSEMGPYDLDSLSADWDDGDARDLWLEFSQGGNINRSIRIGWIRLTE